MSLESKGKLDEHVQSLPSTIQQTMLNEGMVVCCSELEVGPLELCGKKRHIMMRIMPRLFKVLFHYFIVFKLVSAVRAKGSPPK